MKDKKRDKRVRDKKKIKKKKRVRDRDLFWGGSHEGREVSKQ